MSNVANRLNTIKNVLRIAALIFMSVILLIGFSLFAAIGVILIVSIFASTKIKPLNMGDGTYWSWDDGPFTFNKNGVMINQ